LLQVISKFTFVLSELIHVSFHQIDIGDFFLLQEFDDISIWAMTFLDSASDELSWIRQNVSDLFLCLAATRK